MLLKVNARKKVKKLVKKMMAAMYRQYMLTLCKSFLSMASIAVPIRRGMTKFGTMATINAKVP